MHRILALAILLATPLRAQEPIFVAPSSRSVVASTEQPGAPDGAHVMYVANNSSVPVVVFAFSLRDCQNVRKDCGVPQRLDITIPPGGRRQVGHVQPADRGRSFSYRWGFSVRAHGGEAAVAALREHGYVLDAAGMPQAVEGTGEAAAGDSRELASSRSDSGSAAPPAAGSASGPPMEPLRPLVASREVDGIAQATSAIAPTRQFWVVNRSTYPIIVYSFNLATCLNVKQVCGRAPVNVRVPAGGRMQVGRVDAQDRTRRYSYDWTYDWRLDTADTRVAAALRARGEREGTLGSARNLAIQPEPVPAKQMTTSVKERFRFKVARGSILASTQAPGGVVLATGACIDPAELAALQRDTTIVGTAFVAPRFTPRSISLPMLPAALRDAGTGPVRVLARWAVDLDGGSIPGSVSILESPHGLVSVQACGAVIGARLEPGRDAAGQPVRTWVEVPLRIDR